MVRQVLLEEMSKAKVFNQPETHKICDWGTQKIKKEKPKKAKSLHNKIFQT